MTRDTGVRFFLFTNAQEEQKCLICPDNQWYLANSHQVVPLDKCTDVPGPASFTCHQLHTSSCIPTSHRGPPRNVNKTTKNDHPAQRAHSRIAATASTLPRHSRDHLPRARKTTTTPPPPNLTRPFAKCASKAAVRAHEERESAAKIKESKTSLREAEARFEPLRNPQGTAEICNLRTAAQNVVWIHARDSRAR